MNANNRFFINNLRGSGCGSSCLLIRQHVSKQLTTSVTSPRTECTGQQEENKQIEKESASIKSFGLFCARGCTFIYKCPANILTQNDRFVFSTLGRSRPIRANWCGRGGKLTEAASICSASPEFVLNSGAVVMSELTCAYHSGLLYGFICCCTGNWSLPLCVISTEHFDWFTQQIIFFF